MNVQSQIRFSQSLFVKIGLMLAICMVMIGAVSTIVSLTREVSAAVEETVRRAEGESELLAEQNVAPLKYQKADVLVSLFDATVAHSDGSAVGIAAVDADGAIVAQSTGFDMSKSVAEGAPLTQIVTTALETGKSARSPDGLLIAIPAFNAQSGSLIGAFAFAWQAEPAIAAIKASEKVKLGLSLVIFAVALVGAMFASRQIIVHPVKTLGSAVQAIARHEFAFEIPGQFRKDEIGEISRAVESLRQALAQGETLRLDSIYKSAAFNESSAAMMMVDADGIMRYINRSMDNMLRDLKPHLSKSVPDFDPDKIINTNINSFHNGARHMDHVLEKARKGPVKVGMAIGTRRLQLTIAAIKDEASNEVGFVVEWVDVTEAWLKNAIISTIDSSQAKLITDLEGNPVEANAIFLEALGIDEANLSGRSFDTFLMPGSMAGDFQTFLSEVTASPFHGMLTFRSTDGQARYLNGTISCVRDDAGVPVHLLLIAKDVTESEAALRAAQVDRDEAEQQQSRVVDALRVAMRNLSDGDLSCEISESFAGSYDDLRRDYNATIATLSAVLSDVFNHAQAIRNESGDISATADSLSRRTENTAATLEQTAAALDELTRSVAGAAEGAAIADRVVGEAKVNAEQSGQVVLETVEAMDMIASSSQKITSIIKVIDDIAFQTNLLALNAGVEAARAGDAGRGFAVVASEVRALAQRSSEAAREINELIVRSAGQVRRGVDLVGRTGEALKEIVASVSNISTLVSDMAVSSKQQSEGLAEINAAVNDLDQSTQQNAARLEEATAAAEALNTSASTMTEMISHFRLINGNAPEVRSEPNRHPAKKTTASIQVPADHSTFLDSRSSIAIKELRDHDPRDLAAWEDF